VALLVLVLISTRSQAFVALLLLTVVGALGALYARGLRLVVRSDVPGQFGLRFIRWAALLACGRVLVGVCGWDFVMVVAGG